MVGIGRAAFTGDAVRGVQDGVPSVIRVVRAQACIARGYSRLASSVISVPASASDTGHVRFACSASVAN